MTNDEGTKLSGIAAGATKVAKSDTNGNVKINDVETVVYTLPSDVVRGQIATTPEVTEMLNGFLLLRSNYIWRGDILRANAF